MPCTHPMSFGAFLGCVRRTAAVCCQLRCCHLAVWCDCATCGSHSFESGERIDDGIWGAGTLLFGPPCFPNRTQPDAQHLKHPSAFLLWPTTCRFLLEFPRFPGNSLKTLFQAPTTPAFGLYSPKKPWDGVRDQNVKKTQIFELSESDGWKPINSARHTAYHL